MSGFFFIKILGIHGGRGGLSYIQFIKYKIIGGYGVAWRLSIYRRRKFIWLDVSDSACGARREGASVITLKFRVLLKAGRQRTPRGNFRDYT